MENPADKNIRAIVKLEREALHERSGWERISDAITGVTGSPHFIVLHAVIFIAWIAMNVTSAQPFDPYPFELLTLAVSLEAIVLTSFVLMTQNRMSHQADKRAHLDLQVDLLAEQELTALLRMMYALCKQAGVNVALRDGRIEEMLKQTDIHKISVELDREL